MKNIFPAMDRRSFVGGLLAASAVGAVATIPSLAMAQSSSKTVGGSSRSDIELGRSSDSAPQLAVTSLNHASFPCSDLQATIDWCGRVFGMPVYAFQDYKNSMFGGNGQSVLRLGRGSALAYVALAQMTPEELKAQASKRPHFCFGMRDFSVDKIFAALSKMPAKAESFLREGKTINGVNFTDPDGFPMQFNPDTACGGSGFLGETCDMDATVKRQADWPAPVELSTFNHVRMVVKDIDSTIAWYGKLTDMKPHVFDFGSGGKRTILRIGSGPEFVILEQGPSPRTFKPLLGVGVRDFNADEVVDRLKAHKVPVRVEKPNGETPEIFVEGPNGMEFQVQDVSYCGGFGPLGNKLA